MNKLTKRERFEEKVLSRYHVYNSVFATLPYDLISDTGQLLPILTAMCKNGFKNKSQPLEIIDNFFSSTVRITIRKKEFLYCLDSYSTSNVRLFFLMQ